MANIAPTVQDYVGLFQQGRLSLASPITLLKYIGAYYAQQMLAHPFTVATVDDLIRQTSGKSLPQLRQLLAEYVKNRQANQCRVRGQKIYHVRDFNFVAFNSLVNALKAARQLNLGAHGHAARLPGEIQDVRDASTAQCSCRTTRAMCAMAVGNEQCAWKDAPAGAAAGRLQNQGGLCVPVQRVRRAAGPVGKEGVAFPGIKANEPGQKRRRMQAPEPGQTFLGVWRVPL